MKAKNKPSLADSIREILVMLCKLDFWGLLKAPTENGLLQFCRYCLVSGVETVVDWGVLYLAERLVHYLLAAVAGFVCGLSCNYILSKWMVFNGSSAKMDSRQEFLAYAAIGVAGLGITLILMYVMTEWLRLHFMLSKVIATVLVLMWNFLARKMLYH